MTHSDALTILRASALVILPIINAWAGLSGTGASITSCPSFFGIAARNAINAAEFLIDFSGVVFDAISTEISFLPLKAADDGQ